MSRADVRRCYPLPCRKRIVFRDVDSSIVDAERRTEDHGAGFASPCLSG